MIERANAHLFLVGFMGAGKSTLATLLSQRVGWCRVDLDAAIEDAEGSSIEAMIRTRGEEEFRRIETATLREIPASPRAVVATGGGAFLSAGNRDWMRRGVSVWLDVSIAEARERTAAGSGRPLWRNDDPASFRALFERRRAVYALASHRVVTSQKAPNDVLTEVFKLLEGFFD